MKNKEQNSTMYCACELTSDAWCELIDSDVQAIRDTFVEPILANGSCNPRLLAMTNALQHAWSMAAARWLNDVYDLPPGSVCELRDELYGGTDKLFSTITDRESLGKNASQDIEKAGAAAGKEVGQ